MKAISQINRYVASKKSGTTKKQYRRTLRLFIEYCDGLGLGYDVDFAKLIPVCSSDKKVLFYKPIDQLFVKQFLAHRTTLKDNQDTLRRHLMHLRLFFHDLVNYGVITVNPCDSIDRIRVPHAKEEVHLNLEECIWLLWAAIESDFPERNFALIKVFLTTAMRPKEVLSLQVEDVDFFRKCIYISRWQKTGTFGTVPLYDQVARDIYKYLQHEERKNQTAKELFLNNDKPFTGKELGHLVKELCEKAGINKPFTPRGFRHTTATLLFVNGIDIVSLKELLRHKRLQNTKLYTHGWTHIPTDPRLTPNADLLSNFIRDNFHTVIKEL